MRIALNCKKLLYIVFLIFVCGTSYADDLSNLENSSATKAEPVYLDNVDSYMEIDPYAKETATFSEEKTNGNFTFGAKVDNTFTSDTYNPSRTIFSEYKHKNFTFNTSLKNENMADWQHRGQGTLSFSPEYKINNHVTVQNVYSTNFLDDSKKSEFIFSLKPFKSDRMDLNVGASQVMYSEDVRPPRSQLNFSTKFKL